MRNSCVVAAIYETGNIPESRETPILSISAPECKQKRSRIHTWPQQPSLKLCTSTQKSCHLPPDNLPPNIQESSFGQEEPKTGRVPTLARRRCSSAESPWAGRTGSAVLTSHRARCSGGASRPRSNLEPAGDTAAPTPCAVCWLTAGC